MKYLLSIITACFVVHTYVDVKEHLTDYNAPVPATMPTLPAWTVKAETIVHAALLSDLMNADADASDECTFTVNGEPIAFWKNGTLTLLP